VHGEPAVSHLPAVVLAGERSGGSALARAHGVTSSVLIEIHGRSLLARVLDTLGASATVAGGVVVGPQAACLTPAVEALFARRHFRWLAPACGPSASALAGIAALARYPVLVTAADHALLEAAAVDDFCGRAAASAADFVFGLVPHAVVHARFPHSRRTRLRFADGTYCGANLFLVRSAAGAGALTLWRELESLRKQPWRIAARLGTGLLARYISGRLPLAAALAALSARAGCTVDAIALASARAAVDVDSLADLSLAKEVLAHE